MHTRFLVVLAIAIFVVMSLSAPRQFPTAANLESMGYQMSEVGILTLAMMLAMVMGGIDLSVTAIANLCAITAGLVMLASKGSPGGPAAGIVFSIAGALGVGAVCGAVNGLLVGRVRIPAILATLGTLTLYTGLAFGITRGRAVHGFPDAILSVGIGKLLGVPVPLILFGAAAAVISLVLNRTPFGYKLFLLGTNPVAAKFSGIDGAAVTLRSHALGGLLSAVAGIITLARTNSANADYGTSYLLMAILVAVLGGVSVTGGFGRVSGIVLALASLQMLSSGLNMLLIRFSGGNFFRDFAWGFLLLFAMVLSRGWGQMPRALTAENPASRESGRGRNEA
jgi:simple sugar transport system permease protein